MKVLTAGYLQKGNRVIRLPFRIGYWVLFAFVCFGVSTEVFAIEEAKMLPKGISRFRLVGVSAATVDSKFNASGNVTTLGGANVSMDIADIANSLKGKDQADLKQLISALNTIQAGAGDALFNVNTFQDISMQQNIFGGAYEYGLSDRWNIGVRFRVVQANIKSQYSQQVTDNIGATLNSLKNGQAVVNQSLESGMISLQQKLNAQAFSAESVFASKGYSVPGDFETTDLGYTEVGAKYLVHKSDRWLGAAVLGVRIPTGKDESLTNPLDRGTGGNFWGTGLQLLEDFYINDYLTVTGSVKADYYFSDTKLRAVPRNENDRLPSLLPQDGQVQEVTRQTGALLETELALKSAIPGTHFTVAGAYQYKQKAADSYEGPGDLYYGGLGIDSDYKINAAEAMVSFSTIQLYRAGKFGLPLAIDATYNRAFSGVNTPKLSYARVDLKVYF